MHTFMLDKFGKMKDLYAMKRQADSMKKEMEQIVVEVFEGEYKIVMKGDQTVDKVFKGEIERNDLKKLFNKAVKESQKKVAKKMRGRMSELGLPGL